jgi:hypothetical protein
MKYQKNTKIIIFQIFYLFQESYYLISKDLNFNKCTSYRYFQECSINNIIKFQF